MGDFSVHAERVEAFLGFFSIIRLLCQTPHLSPLEDHRRPFDMLRTDIEDPPVIIKILKPSGPTDPRPAACAGSSSRSIPDNLTTENYLPTQADGAARPE